MLMHSNWSYLFVAGLRDCDDAGLVRLLIQEEKEEEGRVGKLVVGSRPELHRQRRREGNSAGRWQQGSYLTEWSSGLWIQGRAGSQDTARGVSLLVLSEITDPPTLAFRSSDRDLPSSWAIETNLCYSSHFLFILDHWARFLLVRFLPHDYSSFLCIQSLWSCWNFQCTETRQHDSQCLYW